jgi:hypothetical protein
MVAPAHIAFAAPVDQHPARVMGQSDILIEAVEEVCGHGFSGFDLHRDAPGSHVEDEVHLQSTGIAPEMEGRPLPVVEKELLDFVDGEIFKDGSPQGVRPQIFGPAYAQEVTQESGVQEIELGALDDPFGEVCTYPSSQTGASRSRSWIRGKNPLNSVSYRSRPFGSRMGRAGFRKVSGVRASRLHSSAREKGRSSRMAALPARDWLILSERRKC